MDLETAIAAQVGTTPPEEITQLVLDACKATKVSGLEKFVNLRELTINGCGLTSLEGFPTLAKLEVLQLNDNQLTDGCLEALQDAGLLTLHTLSLAGNRFSTLESLEPLVRPHLFATSRPLLPARAACARSRAAPRSRQASAEHCRRPHCVAGPRRGARAPLRTDLAAGVHPRCLAERVRQSARPRSLQLRRDGKR